MDLTCKCGGLCANVMSKVFLFIRSYPEIVLGFYTGGDKIVLQDY